MSSVQYSKVEGYDSRSKLMGEEGYGDSRRRMFEICMVFRCKPSKSVRSDDKVADGMHTGEERDPTPHEKNQMQMWKQRREAILRNLQNIGLHIFCYYGRDRDTVIAKIGVPAQKLRDVAARIKYKLQLKKQYLSAYAEYRHDFPGRRELNFSDRRVISHIYQTHTEDDFPDSDAIFKTLDKIYLLNHIITSKDKDCAGIRTAQLLHTNDLTAYFPLHEANALAELKMNWINWLLMPEEHANRLRDYFGDKIAFYFLFMAFYLKWLIPITIVGLCLQFIDVVVQTPDNITAIPFCILMSVWCTFLPYFWRRQEAKYAIGWGTLDLVEELEPCRPEHEGEPRLNPVSGQVEPFYPTKQRAWWYLLSCIVVTVMTGFLIFSMLCLSYWRHTLQESTYGGLLTWQIIICVYVEAMNRVLTEISRWLTNKENHRTRTQHETAMLVKVMLFKFICSYSILYYTAFWKHAAVIFNQPMHCIKRGFHAQDGDCFLDVQQQLAVFVVFRLTIANVFEYIGPKVRVWWSSTTVGRNPWRSFTETLRGHTLVEMADMSSGEQQAKKPRYDEFSDLDETLISHGFATFFAVTAPWVCAATFFGTALEIYYDMRSLMDSHQRPIPKRARNNEPWSTAFDIYGVLAASTNIFLLIFASHQYDNWTFTEKLLLFIYLEHMILVARLLLRLIFPEVPRNVELLQLKQENTVHRCLENIKVEQNQDFSMFRDAEKDLIEVFEQDILERDEEDDVEPELDALGSLASMVTGVKEEGGKWLGTPKK